MGKHIAIVGYGSAALVMLKTLQDLPRSLRQGWRVTIYERRDSLGGQWWVGTTLRRAGGRERERESCRSDAILLHPIETRCTLLPAIGLGYLTRPCRIQAVPYR